MKDIFKFEDFRGVLTEGNANLHAISIIANDLIRERLNVGHCTVDENGAPMSPISNEGYATDTHKIYYITEPIEEEKADDMQPLRDAICEVPLDGVVRSLLLEIVEKLK